MNFYEICTHVGKRGAWEVLNEMVNKCYSDETPLSEKLKLIEKILISQSTQFQKTIEDLWLYCINHPADERITRQAILYFPILTRQLRDRHRHILQKATYGVGNHRDAVQAVLIVENLMNMQGDSE